MDYSEYEFNEKHLIPVESDSCMACLPKYQVRKTVPGVKEKLNGFVSIIRKIFLFIIGLCTVLND